MPDGSIPLLVSLFVLIAFSAFFSATETAYTSASRIRLKSLATGGNRRAEKVLALCENSYDKLLSTILIGNNIVNLSASTISALLFAKILFGSRLNPSIVSTAAITVVVLIFGEITPKYIGKFCAEKLADGGLSFYFNSDFFILSAEHCVFRLEEADCQDFPF